MYIAGNSDLPRTVLNKHSTNRRPKYIRQILTKATGENGKYARGLQDVKPSLYLNMYNSTTCKKSNKTMAQSIVQQPDITGLVLGTFYSVKAGCAFFSASTKNLSRER